MCTSARYYIGNTISLLFIFYLLSETLNATESHTHACIVTSNDNGNDTEIALVASVALSSPSSQPPSKCCNSFQDKKLFFSYFTYIKQKRDEEKKSIIYISKYMRIQYTTRSNTFPADTQRVRDDVTCMLYASANNTRFLCLYSIYSVIEILSPMLIMPLDTIVAAVGCLISTI